jgi:hypothetical protein
MAMVDTFGASLLAHLPDSKTNRAKDELDKANQALSKIPFLRGVMHTLTVPSLGTASLLHKLGREPQGWIVMGAKDAIPCLYQTASNRRVLTLANAIAADVTIEIWVF